MPRDWDLPVTIKDGLSPALTLIHVFRLFAASPERETESDGGHGGTREKGRDKGNKRKEARISHFFIYNALMFDGIMTRIN